MWLPGYEWPLLAYLSRRVNTNGFDGHGHVEGGTQVAWHGLTGNDFCGVECDDFLMELQLPSLQHGASFGSQGRLCAWVLGEYTMSTWEDQFGQGRC